MLPTVWIVEMITQAACSSLRFPPSGASSPLLARRSICAVHTDINFCIQGYGHVPEKLQKNIFTLDIETTSHNLQLKAKFSKAVTIHFHRSYSCNLSHLFYHG